MPHLVWAVFAVHAQETPACPAGPRRAGASSGSNSPGSSHVTRLARNQYGGRNGEQQRKCGPGNGDRAVDMKANDARRFKELEGENARLKKLAEAELDKSMLKERSTAAWPRDARRRDHLPSNLSREPRQ